MEIEEGCAVRSCGNGVPICVRVRDVESETRDHRGIGGSLHKVCELGQRCLVQSVKSHHEYNVRCL